MKRCPVCRRDYTDETLNYCLDDGATLLDGPGSGNEARTAILSGGSDSFDSDRTKLLSDSTPVPKQSNRRRLIFTCAIGLFALGVSGWAAFRFIRLDSAPPISFQNSTLTRVSTSGRAVEADISPDGKYVVYLEMGDDGNRSLWVKQIATGNSIPIVPPTKGNVLKSTTFSRDSNFVYYLFSDRTRGMSLYQVSSLGGTPKKIIDVCESAVAVSPDGQHLAFVRYGDVSKSIIVMARADGSDEREVASVAGEEWFVSAGASWSPDGKTIAVLAGKLIDGADQIRLVGIDVNDGTIRELSPKRWLSAGRVVWMPDASSLLLVAVDRIEEPGMQVWQVGYPSGEATRITNDVQFRDDTTLGVTSDGKTIITVSIQRRSRIESIPASGQSDRISRLTTAEANAEGLRGISAVSDGRIVYSSFEGGQSDIWIMNADGSERRKLTSDAFRDEEPTVSPDGRYVVFKSNRQAGDAVSRLWRMNIDGSDMVQLAERSDSGASISPDGRIVLYSAWDSDTETPALWKGGIDGGPSVRLTDYPTRLASFSPDGKWVGAHFSEAVSRRWLYGILPAEGGPPVRHFYFHGFQYEWNRWTPDSRNISFVGSPPDPSNIWLQPAEGGNARKLTDFKTDYIFRHEWSRDGKTLFLVRGRPSHDVVLQTVGN